MRTIGIFFGSRSPEHDISIITAMRVIEGLGALPHYRPIPVYIGKDGRWFSGKTIGEVAFFRQPDLGQALEPYGVTSLSLGGEKLILHPKRRLLRSSRPVRIEVAFPCFHGSLGEDGTIQGLFEIAGIPYVGCGVLASALGMSKIHSRRLLREVGISTPPTIEVLKDSFERDKGGVVGAVSQRFPYPLFVKPNALGSSIAVAKVGNSDELAWAFEVVFQFDTIALVEPAVPDAREINVAVIGHRELVVSKAEEPKFRAAFQTFETKYITKGGTISQTKGKAVGGIPADLPAALAGELKAAAEKSFRLLGCSGISRFDFLVNGKTNRWYLGEVNTLPGTLHAHLWAASGIPLHQLIEKLLGFAEERHREEQALVRAFASSVLQQK